MVKKTFSLVLIFALTLSSITTGAWWATESVEEKADIQGRVTLIVELEGGGVLEKTKSISKLTAYTQESNTAESAVAGVQAVAEEVLTESVDCEVVGSLDYVANALIVETVGDEIEAIKNLDGVKNVYVSEKRNITEPVECETVMDLGKFDLRGIEQRDAIALDKVSDEYDGEGLVIGIIDSELWYDHSAFSTEPVNPRLSEDSIDGILASGTLKAETLLGREMTATDVHKSEKVPFAFDYANKDIDPKADPEISETNNKNYHGTHVAGIAAAKSEMLSGIAPEAQIIFAKVCNDGTRTVYDTVVCQALDDFAKLKPDIINLSLGTDSGFSGSGPYESLFQTLEDAGICISASAGNSGRLGDRFDFGAPYASMPDYGTVLSPSTLPQAVSVASLSTDIEADSIYDFTLEDGTVVEYYDSSHYHTAARMRTAINGVMTQYVDCKMGAESEFEEAGDLTGKIALIARGGDSIQNIFARAEAKGAIGIILINTEGTANIISLESCQIPSAIVSPQNGAVLTAAASKKLTANSGAYTISSFSARGTTPDLKLKPEVTAVGGRVVSAAYNDGFAYMSGTSMSTPQYAGAHLLALDYINNGLKLSMSAKDKTRLAGQLLASTAVIWTADGLSTGVAQTPRAQGAGVINLEKMIKTPAVIVNTYNEKTKVELGEIESNVLTVSFKIKNISAKDVTYNLSADVVSDGYSEKTVNQTTAKVVDGMRKLKADIGFDTGSVITVPANDEKTVVMTATLDTAELQELGSVFTNGFFVDGYVRCSNETDPEISIPFTGFYGNWGALPIFGGEEYGLTNAAIKRDFDADSSGVALRCDSDGAFYYSPNTGYMGIALQPLRNIKTLQLKIYDKDDTLLYSTEEEYIRKANKTSTGSLVYRFVGKFDGTKDGAKVPDGELKMEILAVPDREGAEPQSLAYNIYMDSVCPKIEDISLKTMTVNETTSRWLSVNATDSPKNLLMVGLEDGEGEIVEFQYSLDDGTSLMNVLGYTLPSYKLVIEDIAQNRVSLPIRSETAFIGEYDGEIFKGVTNDSVFVSGEFILDRHDVTAPAAGFKKIFVWDESFNPIVPCFIVE